ncbi:MAG: hypothetical protein DYG83_07095 [Candidatus Brocadia sp. AMX2]|uniref:DUF4129 domain-containing protein n=2 Tax=Candidatus Brocadiaceae TaxID=1127830 RepID=A0ABQ0JSE9_9BACT|nr:MAG: hypothetical protein EDM70_00945 [Candidatus Brocadia sp. AMX2]MBC6931298.1 hypothetical protein [Candidatus Brocadia sp.]MBL1168645.1 hypothetical protein [Candidatus Brocadia sp. AMX1]GAN31652.1 hypothetical protein BROSI_A0153 [Candidatus Brocadia sinica JPN1]GIK12481.1 MAG: hypothetical protein BroJett002_11880 [Candidatus Brocadia sinica]
MVIKRYNLLLNTLLIFTLVVYTLMSFKDTIFAIETKDTGDAVSIEATAYTDRNEITIGDKIKFGIHVKYRNDLTVEFPKINQQLGAFTVKETGGIAGDKREKDGYFTVEQNYVLSSYEIGRQTIPSLKIRYKSSRGTGEVVTNEITIDVRGVLKEGETAADIKDIFPPMNVPTNFRRLVTWIFAGLAALSLSAVIYWLINKRKNGYKKQSQEFIVRAPHEVAYELLENLLKEDLISKGLIKEYYYRLTDIVRHYIEKRFGLLAPERTTEEFLDEMAHTNKLDDTHKRLIQEFLERCDMVKYARYGPSRSEIQETYDAAKRFIDETRERFEEKEVVAH